MGKENSQDQLIDQRDPGFYIVDEEVVDEYGAKIGPLGLAVYNVLVRYANKQGTSCFPSYQTIADKLGISRPSAVKGVQILIDHKLVRKHARVDEAGDAASNDYKILPVKKRAKDPEGVVKNFNHPHTLSDAGGKDSLPGSQNSLPPVVRNFNHGGKESLPYPDPLNQTHLNQTHTQAARGAPTGNGVRVSAAAPSTKVSRFSLDERKAYARENKLGAGWLTQSGDGRYDEGIQFALEEARAQQPSQAVDISECPDCRGSTLKPSATGGGMTKCRHEQLIAATAR